MMASEVFFGDIEMEEANLAYQILKSVMKVRTFLKLTDVAWARKPRKVFTEHCIEWRRMHDSWIQAPPHLGTQTSSFELKSVRRVVGSC